MSLQVQRHHHHSPSPFTCFRPSPAADTTTKKPSPTLSPPLPPPQTSGKTNLATSFYNTNLGLFSLTWSRTFLGHSLHINLNPSSHLSPSSPLSISTLHFHLHVKPFVFWKKYGNKKLSSTATDSRNVHIFWDFSKVEFGSGPEPESGFYIAIVVDGEIILLVGDCTKEAYARTKVQKHGKRQALVSRREHLFGNKLYTTKARFGGKRKEISIECRVNEDAELCFSVDNRRVLRIKRLKWKFRGNEKIEVDGVSIQVSWDVYNWLFDEDLKNGHAVFGFKFENDGSEIVGGDHHHRVVSSFNETNGVVLCQRSPCSKTKMRKSLLMSARSSSSSSISTSSGSSGGSSSVMEWASVEESELSAPTGFSLLVYAWKK